MSGKKTARRQYGEEVKARNARKGTIVPKAEKARVASDVKRVPDAATVVRYVRHLPVPSNDGQLGVRYRLPKNDRVARFVRRMAVKILDDRFATAIDDADEACYSTRGHARTDVADYTPKPIDRIRRTADGYMWYVSPPKRKAMAWGERLSDDPFERRRRISASPYRHRVSRDRLSDNRIQIVEVKTNARARKRALQVGKVTVLIDERMQARILHAEGRLSRATMEATKPLSKSAKRRKRRERAAELAAAFIENGGTFA